MIALQSNANKVHLIYTNKSMDLQTPVTVQVERSGVYQVTMFAIREDSTLACSEQAIVDVQIETTELQPPTGAFMGIRGYTYALIITSYNAHGYISVSWLNRSLSLQVCQNQKMIQQ